MIGVLQLSTYENDNKIAGVIHDNTVPDMDVEIAGVNDNTDVRTIGVIEDEAISTVDESKKCFSKKDRLKAEIAKHFHILLVYY